MTQQANSSTSASQSGVLYPPLESIVAALDESELIVSIANEDKKMRAKLRDIQSALQDVSDTTYLPEELFASQTTTKKKPAASAKSKVDLLNKLKDLPIEDVEEEEEPEDEEEEDEEVEKVEDEEEDAGGDYLVTHFDNGENFEDNDDEGDDMTSMI